MGKTQILGTVAIVPKGDWQENTSYELLNLIRYEGASYLAIRKVPENTLPTDVNYWQLVATDGVANVNLENGEGDYSIVQKTAEGEENEATAEGTYAGGKKCKSTAKRGFTHGNTVTNNGNSAASFGQQYTNDGNCALTQQVDGYNGGAGAVVVGQEIYNKKNQTANVPSSEGGSASALVGAYLYNRGSHSQLLGYLLKNRRALKTVFGIANKDKENTIFEIGGGKEITTVASDNKSFTYNGYTYTVNYDENNNNKIESISFPPNAPSYPKTIAYYDEKGHTDYRVETEGGVEICLALVNGVLKVYEPYNIFEIDENGNVVTKGNIDGKKLTITHLELLGSMLAQTGTFTNGFSAFKGLAKLLLKEDGVEVQGKGKFDGDVSGYKGTFSDGFYTKKQLAELELKDNGVRVQGKMSVSNPPTNSTDVVRLTELDAVKQTIETLHKNGFVVVALLPTASKDTVGKIYLIPQASSSTNDVYDEYITIETSTNVYAWEKIGSTQFTLIVDSELSLESENPVQNKVVTEALDGKVNVLTSNSGGLYVYGQNANKQETQFLVANAAPSMTQGRIVMYFAEASSQGASEPPGKLICGTPTKDYHVATKKYVDEAVANAGGSKTYYQHTINIKGENGECYLTKITTISAPVTTKEGLIEILPDLLSGVKMTCSGYFVYNDEYRFMTSIVYNSITKEIEPYSVGLSGSPTLISVPTNYTITDYVTEL